MLRSLVQLAEQENLLAPTGFEMRVIPLTIRLDADGRYIKVEPNHGKKDTRDKKSFKVPYDALADRRSRNAASMPKFLADQLRFTVNYKSRSNEHENFKKLMSEALEDTKEPALEAIMHFLNNEDALAECHAGIDALIASGSKKISETTDSIFSVNEVLITDYESCKQWWHERAKSNGENAGLCVICGQYADVVDKHPQIKFFGTSTSLFNRNNAAFRQKYAEMFEHCQTCKECAEKYAVALGRLINGYTTPSGKTLAPQTISFGTNLKSVLWTLAEEQDILVSHVRDTLEDPLKVITISDWMKGYRRDINGVTLKDAEMAECYIVSILSNESRIGIQSYDRLSAYAMYKNLCDFFTITHVESSEGSHRYKPYVLAKSLATSAKDKGTDKIAHELLLTALTGASFPVQVQDSLIERFNAEGFTRPRMALARACIINDLRKTMSTETAIETVPPDINREWDDPAYLLGRLLAVIKCLQHRAVGKKNKTIIDGYYTGVSTTPSIALGQILTMTQVYIADIQKGNPYAKNWLIDEFRDILSRIPCDENTFKNAFSPMQQIRLAWGMFNEESWLNSEYQKGKPTHAKNTE